MKSIKFGLTIFTSFFIPSKKISYFILGPMYGASKSFEPSVYIALSLFITIIISFSIVEALTRMTKLKDKIPSNYKGHGIFLTCGLIILVPKLMQIFTSTIQGGGASYLLRSITSPITIIASVLLFMAVIKLFRAIQSQKSLSEIDSLNTKH